MCVDPTYIWLEQPSEFVGSNVKNWRQQPVACGRCWACLQNKENDLIGRCLAEASTSDWVHTLTLTYDDRRCRPGDYQTTVLCKADFQQFMKRLRLKHSVRYLVAGEYGGRKGRAHFHAILFGDGEPPDASHLQQKAYYPAWPWGYVWSDPTISPRSIRYVAKYLTKGKRKPEGKHSQEWLSYSKEPLLGGHFFRELGYLQGAAKVAPPTLNYMPPHYHGKGKFSMYGRAQDEYFAALLTSWPGFATATKTKWVENAFRRYSNRLHVKAWCDLSDQQRTEALMDVFARLRDDPLTTFPKSAYEDERQAQRAAIEAVPGYWEWRARVERENENQRYRAAERKERGTQNYITLLAHRTGQAGPYSDGNDHTGGSTYADPGNPDPYPE